VPSKHSVARFPSRQLSVKVKNAGNVRMPIGSCAILTWQANANTICVRMTASSTLSVRQLVIGPVDFTGIEVGGYGSVRIRGRHTSLLVSGNVVQGDLLGPSTTVAGEWTRRETSGYDGCVIAHEDVSSSSVNKITGYVVTWRS
jgi:hypothetical protein